MMNNCTNNFIKRVIGVTRTFKWTITTNGAAVPLVAEDLTLQLVPPRGEAVSLPFDVDDNVVSFTWQGDDQHIIGCYSLILWANYGEDNQRRVDIHNFVELIPWSDRQSGEYSDLVEETIELETADFGENIMVVDNLNSTSATDALSANMGRQLNVTKQDVIQDLAAIRSGAAAGAAVKEWAKNDPLITDDGTQVSASKLAFNGNLFEQWVPGIASSIGLKGIAGFLKLADISQWDSAYNDRMLPTVAAVKAKLQAVLTALATIEAVIPSQASSTNKLTDKDYVDGAIATNTANFVGTFDTLAELQAVPNPTKNDYGFVIESDAQGNEYYDRYKYTGTQWLYEYKVESTPFTTEQWAAIQSGITAALVSKLSALPTNAELNTALAAKQPVINDLTTIRSGAAAGATAYQKPAAGIPKTDLASGVQASLDKADAAAPQSTTYTKTEVDAALALKQTSSQIATINGSDITHGGNVTIVAAEGQTITIDAAPTAGSSNAVSSGGVFDALASAGVYDVSAKNSGATFASLSALLSNANLSTLIPTAARKGGMSIRFVSSSDNKYVQYFLTKNEWSASGTDWEKMNLEEEVSQLESIITGLPEVTFSKSDYTLNPGLITGGIFRSNSVYGTANSHILIPMTGNAGRKIQLTTVSGHYANTIAFLTTDNLVSGEAAPYCAGTSLISTSGQYVVPDDCVCLYVYAERQGADSFPSLKMLGVDAEVCSSTRADTIEGNLANANQDIETVGKHITVLNVNEVVGSQSGTYTLAEAIAAIPQSMRRGYCVLRYNTQIQSYYFQKIAFFLSLSISGWSDTNNWREIDIKDWSNVSESAGAFKMSYENQTSVGTNTQLRQILVPFEKIIVYKHSSDSFGRWRILIRYTDNTNQFVDISGQEITEITPTTGKTALGFAFYLMSTTETCYIDADVLIGAAERVFELTYKTEPTAESIGAVPIDQGIGNAGRPLVVGADGKVAPGTATPSTVDGDAVRKVLSRELHLGADLASVTSMGTGWSGSVADGFTHASGNTDPLVLNSTTNGNAYLVTINCDTNEENLYLVSIGDGPLLDPYNGTTQQQVGIISDGGAVKITPSSSFAGTMTIKVQECVAEEDAEETVILNVYNVEAENMGAAITAFWNVAIGPGQSTLGKAVSASRNIAIGINSLKNLETGTRNIGVGTFALAQLKNGKGNIGIGADTYYRRQGGDDNVAIGRACMGGATESVNNNTCVGRSAGERVTGDDNVCIGTTAGYAVTSGNVCIGINTGFSHNAGVNNIFIGINAGYSGAQRTGNWNTAVGPSASISNNVSKSVAIGYKSGASKSNQVVLGNYSTTANDGTVETLVHGDFVVRGTDGIMRRIVFNQDNSVSWEAVS